MFYFTGIQHKKTGDVAIPLGGYATVDEYKGRYYHEMDYAVSNEDFIGQDILVFDNAGNTVLTDHWVKQVQVQPEQVQAQPEQSAPVEEGE